MGVKCYRVITHRFEGQRVDVKTWSLAPGNTNIQSLLHRAAPSTRFIETTSDHSARYQIGDGKKELEIVRQLLRSLQKPTVVAFMENFTLAVCLDFHRNPPESPDGNFVRTEIGELVYQAKYGKRQEEKQAAIQVLTERAVSYVSGNPLLRSANGIAAVPRSVKGKKVGPLLASIADALSSELRIPLVDLQRRKNTAKSQKDIDRGDGDDPDRNQKGTMVAGCSGKRVLIVDDLIRYGASMREASRALQAAGTAEVVALVLTKDRKGTESYVSQEE